MGDRFDGTLAGGTSSLLPELSIPLALQNLSLHETLVTTDEDGDVLLFRAMQDPCNGGMMYASEQVEWNDDPLMEAIKRSQMASMLSDDARCGKYAEAISHTVGATSRARVLDVGTGTGLLAMLAARAGAEHVDAVEMFVPLAQLAHRVVRANELHGSINVHAVRSTDLQVATDTAALANGTDNEDLLNADICSRIQQRADILVTEIFDSALLGEACLPVIADMRARLLRQDAKIIPARATIFARVVTSEFLSRFHDLGEDFPLHRSDDGHACRGGVTGIPMHLDSLDEGRDYDYVTDAFKVFDFDFASDDFSVQRERHRTITLQRTRPGRTDAIITWWDLDLLGNGSIVYTTRAGGEEWQDHWLQMVYPLPRRDIVIDETHDSVKLSMAHDDFSLRFTLGTNAEHRVCSCGWHALPGGPYRIHELSCITRMHNLSKRITAALQSAQTEETRTLRCLDVSDGAVCALLAGQQAAKLGICVDIVSADDDEVSAFVHDQVARRVNNDIVSVHSEFEPVHALAQREQTAMSEDASWTPFDVLLSEPFTRTMHRYPIATLGNLIILRRVISQVTRENFTSVPASAQIMTQLLRFKNNTIQKGFRRVGMVQGIDHKIYDDLCSESDATNDTRQRVSLPLFQYRTTVMSAKTCAQAIELQNLDESALERPRYTRVRMYDVESATVDAVALWVVYDDVEESRVQRYELIMLNDEEQSTVEKTKALDLCTQWNRDESVWEIDIDQKGLGFS